MKPVLVLSAALAVGAAASQAQAYSYCACRAAYHRAHYVHYVRYRHASYAPHSYTRVIYEAPYDYGYPDYAYAYERPYVRVVEPAYGYGYGWYGHRWHDHGRHGGWEHNHHGW